MKVPFLEIDVNEIILPNGMSVEELDDELEGGRTNDEAEGPQRIKNRMISEMLKELPTSQQGEITRRKQKAMIIQRSMDWHTPLAIRLILREKNQHPFQEKLLRE